MSDVNFEAEAEMRAFVELARQLQHPDHLDRFNTVWCFGYVDGDRKRQRLEAIVPVSELEMPCSHCDGSGRVWLDGTPSRSFADDELRHFGFPIVSR